MSILFQGSVGTDTIVGTSTAADTITSATGSTFIDQAGDTQGGSTSGDVIFGGGGNDTLSGGAGADWLSSGRNFGGSASSLTDVDALFGGAGADTLWGGIGHDNLFGGTGNDIFVTHGGNEVAFGGQGDDIINVAKQASLTFLYSGDLGNDIINSGGGAGTVLGGFGDDVINDRTVVGAQDNGVLVARADADLAAANDAITIDGFHQLFGNQGNDVITSSSMGDVSIYGGQGDDTLSTSGATGSHILFGNLGNDTISFTGGDATTVFGGQGDDRITGDAGAASTAHSYLNGDLGNDIITAGAGGDTLVGGAGSDTLAGGAGNDTFVINSAAGDSTASANTAASGANPAIDGRFNMDRIASGTFTHGSDHVLITGHNDAIFTTDTNHATVNVAQGAAADYASAFAFAYGGTETNGATDASHFTAGIEYVSVTVTPTGSPNSVDTYIFINDAQHTALDFQGAPAVNGVGGVASPVLANGDILHG